VPDGAAPQWTPQIDVDEALARRLIADRFPALAALPVTRFGNGWDNAAFLVGETFVFRFPTRSIAAPLIETEARVLPAIASALALTISAPQFIGAPGADYPWTFAGYRVVPGATADVRAPSDAEREALAPALGAFLRTLHALDPQAVAPGLPPDEIGRLDHARRFPQARERFARLAAAQLVDDPAIFLAELARIAPPGSRTLAIVHGDLYARHVVIDRDGALSGVIDWGDVHHGDPAIDLAIAHLLLPPPAHAAFRASYGRLDERTWELARYRAIYHAAMTADYAETIGEIALRDASLWALANIRRQLVPSHPHSPSSP
jgi:aminoglycoside phosphotransferase (APT) family kinase protein